MMICAKYLPTVFLFTKTKPMVTGPRQLFFDICQDGVHLNYLQNVVYIRKLLKVKYLIKNCLNLYYEDSVKIILMLVIIALDIDFGIGGETDC